MTRRRTPASPCLSPADSASSARISPSGSSSSARDVTVVDSLVPELGGNRFNIAPVEDRVRVSTDDLRDVAAVDELVEGTGGRLLRRPVK